MMGEISIRSDARSKPAIFEPYSVRQSRVGKLDLRTYKASPITGKMRAQAFHILEHVGQGRFVNGKYNSYWPELEKAIMEEHGYFHGLPSQGRRDDSYERIATYMEQCDTDCFLDVVEIGIRIVQLKIEENKRHSQGTDRKHRIIREIDALNLRFSQNDLGYSLVGWPSTIIRVDSKFTHEKIVDPSINALAELGWEGALAEFLLAHQHFRHGQSKDSVNNSLKAFESTLKCLLTEHCVEYSPTDTSSKLIRKLFDNEVLPTDLKSAFTGIRSVLESGVPTIRNRTSAHGQGKDVLEVSPELAELALNLTATSISFLTKLAPVIGPQLSE